MSLPGKYIYCFIREKDVVNICSSAFANVVSPVYTVPYKELSVVVSNTDVYEFDPTRKNLLNHQRVINKVMEQYSVIPVAFGTVGNNKAEIMKIIEDNYDELLEKIEFLKDKSEVGLKVVWDNAFFNEDIENDKILVLKERVAGKEEDEVLLDKIQLGKLVQERIEFKKEEYIDSIYTPLSRIAVKSKRKDGIPIKTVFNAFFLVNNSDSVDFDKKVEELSNSFVNKLVFSYTGPWPPYNFIDLRINVNTNSIDHE